MFGAEQCKETGSALNPCLTQKENCVYQVSPRPAEPCFALFRGMNVIKIHRMSAQGHLSVTAAASLISVPKFAKCFYTREHL